MIGSRVQRTILTCILSASAVGCAVENSLWSDPDWNRALAKADAQRLVDSDIPAPFSVDPPPLPDLMGDGPLELSLEQAVVLSLRQNRDLQVAQFTPVITGAFELVERGVFDPEFFASGRVSREEAVETARATGGQFSVIGDDNDVAAGVRQYLPTGTDIEVGVTQNRTISNRAPEQQVARVGLTVTQSLLRGAGAAVNLVSVRQAELDTLASEYELRGFVETLVAEAEVAYWQYLLTERKIQIFERSLEVAKQQSDQTLQRIEVGVLSQTEAAAARSEIALREQALIDVRSDLRAARLLLLRLMNLPLSKSETRQITATSRPAAPDTESDAIDARIALAYQLRPDLNEARLRLEQNRLSVIRTRNGLLPRLDLFIALGKTGYDDEFLDSFGDLDGDTYDVAAGFNFSQFIGESASYGLHRAAMATRSQSAAAVSNLEQLVELEVRLAVNNVERARELIGATGTTRQLQEETARAEVERFDVGDSTTLLVAQAQRDLLEAQIGEVEAVANYRIALIRLYLAEGSLLERRGITAFR